MSLHNCLYITYNTIFIHHSILHSILLYLSFRFLEVECTGTSVLISIQSKTSIFSFLLYSSCPQTHKNIQKNITWGFQIHEGKKVRECMTNMPIFHNLIFSKKRNKSHYCIYVRLPTSFKSTEKINGYIFPNLHGNSSFRVILTIPGQ